MRFQKLFQKATQARTGMIQDWTSDAWVKDADNIRQYMADFRKQGMYLDSVDTALYLRSLTQIATQTYDTVYPEIRCRTLLPVSHEIDPGAEHHALQGFNYAGRAKVVKNYANDFPGITLQMGEGIVGIQSIGASYEYTIQEIRAAKLAGRDLTAKKAYFTREAMERELEDIAAVGFSAAGMVGALNSSSVPIISGGVDISGTWDTKTNVSNGDSLTILKDLNIIASYAFRTSSTAFASDTLVLDPDSYAQIATQQMTTYDTRTILQAFMSAQANGGWIKNVEQWVKCTTAGATGNRRAWAYRKTPMDIELQVPQEFEQMPPQPEGMTWNIVCHMRTAGVEHHRPLTEVYVDGIHS